MVTNASTFERNQPVASAAAPFHVRRGNHGDAKDRELAARHSPRVFRDGPWRRGRRGALPLALPRQPCGPRAHLPRARQRDRSGGRNHVALPSRGAGGRREGDRRDRRRRVRDTQLPAARHRHRAAPARARRPRRRSRVHVRATRAEQPPRATPSGRGDHRLGAPLQRARFVPRVSDEPPAACRRACSARSLGFSGRRVRS